MRAPWRTGVARFSWAIVGVAVLLAGQLAGGQQIADSQADFPSGDDSAPKQATNSWFYGYYNFTANGDAPYQAMPGGTDLLTLFPDNQAPGASPTDFWTGSSWDWRNPTDPQNPPWDFIGETGTHPNGINSGAEHWVMRRYVVEASEVGAGSVDLSVQWTLNKTNLNNTGVSGVVFHNGMPVDAATIAGDDGTGVDRTVRIPGVQAGDFIDVAHLPVGLSNLDRSDGSDGSAMTAAISIAPALAPNAVVADSIADFTGIQGVRGWRYGYYNRTADSDGTYQPGDLTEFLGGVTSPGSFSVGVNEFTGTNWDIPNGNPPWTTIGATTGHPNGTNNAAEHWAIRRWVSDVTGPLEMEFDLAKQNTGGGNGVTGRVFVNGQQLGTVTIAGNQGRTNRLNLTLPYVQAGDLIDVALDPTGTDGQAIDGSDGSYFSSVIRLQPNVVADSIADFPAADNSSSASKQGINNWTYGYHNVTANGAYEAMPGGTDDFIPFPDNQGPGTSPTDFWTGSLWDWRNPTDPQNPPWTQISRDGGHPNGSNNAGSGGEQWAIRRWTSEVDGPASITFRLSKDNTAGGSDPNNNGTIARLFVNGQEQGAFSVGGTDGTGRDWTVHVPKLHAGDYVDLALDANGVDSWDGSKFWARVQHIPFASSTRPVADSEADFPAVDNATSDSKQGINGWYYGYHSVTQNGSYEADPAGTDDFIPFPDNEGPGTSATDFWTGTSWDWDSGNPPWTTIGSLNGHPNTGAGDSQWAIRRWVAEEEGDLFVETFFAKQNTGGGDGIIGRLFLNGEELFSQAVAYNDGVGFTDVTFVPGVEPGDFIDLVLDYGGSDGSDGSYFSARIFQAVQPVPEPASVLLMGLGMLLLGVPGRRFRR